MEENKYQPRTEQRIKLERKLHAFTIGVDTEDKDAFVVRCQSIANKLVLIAIETSKNP
jgi:hypothetical protein